MKTRIIVGLAGLALLLLVLGGLLVAWAGRRSSCWSCLRCGRQFWWPPCP